MAAPAVALGTGIGFAVGLGVGYFVAKTHMRTRYENIANKEIDEARAYYIQAKQATEARLKEPLEEVVEYLGYVKVEEAEGAGTEEEAGTSDGASDSDASVPVAGAEGDEQDPDAETEESGDEPTVIHGSATGDIWDYDEELKHRTRDHPYIIHLDEYGELADEGYETTAYSYYESDDILSDERDEVITNVDELVGLDNMQKFGHGTDNINVLLVRNEKLRLDIEILKEPGNYSEDAAGFLQHDYSVEPILRRHPHFDDGNS